MRRSLVSGILASLMLILGGCAENPMTSTGEGALVGGLLGAAAGGVIGHQGHATGAGLLVGGALGAMTGAAIGAANQQPPPPQTVVVQQPVIVQQPGVVQPASVTLDEVMQWTRAGFSDDEIIERIRASHTIYALTAQSINELKVNGVSDRVINALQAVE